MQEFPDATPLEALKRNLQSVQDRIGAAAAKVSRPVSSVRLVAVTKYVGINEIKALTALGVTDIGESRIQDAERKIREFAGAGPGSATRWHLIGHLQTNKADKAAELFEMVHSLDSLRVAQALQKERRKLAGKISSLRPLTCLLEINAAQEQSKFGLPPNAAELGELLKQAASFDMLRLAGLMTMAPYSEKPEQTSRPVFRKLRELLEELNAKAFYPQPLNELSMGMTQDFEIAVEEGATLVRVGSALFEKS
jgi:pyridoxal phosphate enzyme (YggS family)